MQSRGLSKQSTPKKIDRRDKGGQLINFDTQKALLNKKITIQTSRPTELSNCNDSYNQTLTHTRTSSTSTCQNASDSTKNTAELGSCKYNFEPLASAIEYLLKNQTKFGLIIEQLANNFHEFVNNIQKSKEQQIMTYDNLPLTTSRTTKSENENHHPDICYASNFSTLLAQIELISKETSRKFQQYENFLKGSEHRRTVVFTDTKEQKNDQKRLKDNWFQNSTKKTSEFLSECLQTSIEKVTPTVQPTQNINIVSTTEGSEEICLKHLGEKVSHKTSEHGPDQTISNQKDNSVQRSPRDNFGTFINSASSSRRSSQNKIEIPTSPQDARKKRPVLHLNLPSRSSRNIVESIAEKTENYLARSLKFGPSSSKTHRDTISHAVKQKIIETNRNKRADLDLVISKIHDETKYLKGSLTSRETTFEKTRPFQHFNLDETSTNLKNLTERNSTMSPSNVEGMKIFSTLTTSSGKKIEYSIQKSAIKPENNSLPKKELSETSLRCSEEPSQVSNGSQQTKVVDQAAQKATLQHVAWNEKLEIKHIMKVQYGTDSPYNKADHGKVLQRKYLISAKWWRSWKEFVNFDAKESTEDAKPLVFESHIYKRPGPIPNCDLANEETLKDPKTLEFDLDLKQNLLEHHDFEAVSKQVFELLQTWYGCDYEIYRVLKPDPFHDNKLYLDLYPNTKYKRKQFAKSVTPARSKAEDSYPETERRNML